MIDEMMSHGTIVWQSRKMHTPRALSISRGLTYHIHSFKLIKTQTDVMI